MRDTGATEEHASNVLFVHQPASSTTDYDEWEDVEVIIAKQRSGPARLRIPMQFKKQWGAFRDKSTHSAHTNGAAPVGESSER